MNNKTVIKLTNVGKIYQLMLANGESFYAIKNLSLKIKKGEKIGLMGDNGAGKTTLLKLIAGITTPNEGKISVKGKIAALINLEAGFNQELTGRENIILNGMIYGMNLKEIKEKEKEIIDFSGIGDFIDAPFFTYSSGMRFRLAFAVALSTKPEIILLDEIFLNGDIDFQIKSLKKIEEITKNNKVTLIMASHHPLILRKFCNKFIVLKKGELLDSNFETILGLTQKWNNFFSDVPKTKIEEKMSGDNFYER